MSRTGGPERNATPVQRRLNYLSMTFRVTPLTPSYRHMNRSANALLTSRLSANLLRSHGADQIADARVEPVQAALDDIWLASVLA